MTSGPVTTVLVGVDGSAHSIDAARAGLALLAAPTRVVVLTAVAPVDEMMVTGTGFAGGVVSPQMYDDMREAGKAEGEAVLARAAAALSGYPVETLVAWGDPGEALVTTAAELPAAAIVVGSRGLGGVKRFLLGSVSSHVVKNAPCPVLVVPGTDDD